MAKRLIPLGWILANLVWGALYAVAEVPAEEAPIEVVVTADRFETPLEQAVGSITVITAKEAENKQEISLADALRSVPALDVVRSGPAGGNASVFMRGANAEHTLVLIDGLEVNNPASPNRAYNFADLRFDNVERVEILRGPSSTLYGSDAMGGVINIITKKGQGPLSLYASSEAGSYQTFIERAGLSGGGNWYDYSLGFYREDAAGVSAAAAGFGNSENDGYGNTSFSTRVGFRPLESLEARAFIRYVDARAELDNTGGRGGDDPNRESVNKQFFARGEVNLAPAQKSWQPVFGVSYGRQEFDDNNDPDALHPMEIMRSEYVGSITKLDWQNNVKLNQWLSFVAGIENEKESADSTFFSDGAFGPFESNFSSRSVTTNGYYFQARGEMGERFYLTGGMRVDNHSRFNPQFTWRVGPALMLRDTGTKLLSTVGRGFKAPSLFQLYSAYGSLDLKPEKSLGFDAGIEQSLWKDKAALGATFFYNDFDELISFEPDTFIFTNIAKARTRGLEAWSRFKITSSITLALSYTYTDTEDLETGLALLRRARNKASAGVDFQLSNRTHLSLNLLLVGKRYDNDYSTDPATRVALGSYSLFNIAASYDLGPKIKLFARINNVLDEDYEEVLGYGSLGAAAYGGLMVQL